jgi:hypothetical protein
MSKVEFFKDDISRCDKQAQRLTMAFEEVQKIGELTPKKFEDLDKVQLAFFDMLSTRFSKLQDMIGSKIFNHILELNDEPTENLSVRDKLNKLEKLYYIDDVHWWNKMRDIRNAVSHDYPDDYELLTKHFSELLICANELLEYWASLKTKIETLISK